MTRDERLQKIEDELTALRAENASLLTRVERLEQDRPHELPSPPPTPSPSPELAVTVYELDSGFKAPDLDQSSALLDLVCKQYPEFISSDLDVDDRHVVKGFRAAILAIGNTMRFIDEPNAKRPVWCFIEIGEQWLNARGMPADIAPVFAAAALACGCAWQRRDHAGNAFELSLDPHVGRRPTSEDWRRTLATGRISPPVTGRYSRHRA